MISITSLTPPKKRKTQLYHMRLLYFMCLICEPLPKTLVTRTYVSLENVCKLCSVNTVLGKQLRRLSASTCHQTLALLLHKLV